MHNRRPCLLIRLPLPFLARLLRGFPRSAASRTGAGPASLACLASRFGSIPLGRLSSGASLPSLCFTPLHGCAGSGCTGWRPSPFIGQRPAMVWRLRRQARRHALKINAQAADQACGASLGQGTSDRALQREHRAPVHIVKTCKDTQRPARPAGCLICVHRRASQGWCGFCSLQARLSTRWPTENADKVEQQMHGTDQGHDPAVLEKRVKKDKKRASFTHRTQARQWLCTAIPLVLAAGCPSDRQTLLLGNAV